MDVHKDMYECPLLNRSLCLGDCYDINAVIAKLQKILNHGHPSITLTYIGITDQEIEEDLDSFVL